MKPNWIAPLNKKERESLTVEMKHYIDVPDRKTKSYKKRYEVNHRIKNVKRCRQQYRNEHWKALGKLLSLRRGLGFKPLNKPFKNSHGHHIDKERVIFIPKSAHRRLQHNLEDITSMAKINEYAWKFLKYRNSRI